MTLGELIEELEKHDLERRIPLGFDRPHSYRGYYDCLAFEPKEDISIGKMLDAAKSALDRRLPGWKGGEYVMTEHTPVYLANVGCTGEEIGRTLLDFMLGKRQAPIGGFND